MGERLRVLWLGGAPGSGKSTISRKLASRWPLRVYDFDVHEPAHVVRLQATPHTAHAPFLAGWPEIYVSSTPEELLSITIAAWQERFPLVLEDLTAMPAGSAVLAEGPGVFPDDVAQVVSDRRAALWLISTAERIRRVRRERDADAFRAASDPERALENLIERDILLNEYFAQRVEELSLAAVQVDGLTAMEDLVELVEKHFDLRATAPVAVPDGEGPSGWQRYTGHYQYPGHAGQDVRIHQGRIVISSRESGRTYVLEHERDGSFRVISEPLVGEPVWFGLDAAGRPTRLMMGAEVFERVG